jgi:iron only hydrogenase large subunit-like protein
VQSCSGCQRSEEIRLPNTTSTSQWRKQINPKLWRKITEFKTEKTTLRDLSKIFQQTAEYKHLTALNFTVYWLALHIHQVCDLNFTLHIQYPFTTTFRFSTTSKLRRRGAVKIIFKNIRNWYPLNLHPLKTVLIILSLKCISVQWQYCRFLWRSVS